MGQIRQYESPEASRGVIPSDRGAEAWGQAAYREGHFFHQAAESLDTGTRAIGDAVDRHETMAEISKGSADMTAMFDKLSTDWANTAKTADPNDPNTAQKWRDSTLEPALTEWSGSFSTKGGQNWAMDQEDRLRGEMVRRTASDQSTLAGDALVTNLNSIQAHASNAARNNPSDVGAIHGMVDSAVSALVISTPNLTADQASKARTEITAGIHKEVAKSAVVGAADKNPTAAMDLLNSKDVTDHLDGTDVKSLETYVNSQQRASMEAQRTQATEVRRQQKEDVEAKANQLYAGTIQPDGTTRITPDYWAAVSKLAFLPEAGSLPHAMISYGREVQKAGQNGTVMATDPSTYSDMKTRAALAPSDPRALTLQQVFQAGADGKLSPHDFQFFHQWVTTTGRNPQRIANQKVLDQYEKGMKSFITKSNMLNNDAHGNQRMMEFQQDMQQRFDTGIAAGIKPYDLVNEKNPNYIGKDLHKYQQAPDQAMKDIQGQIDGNIKPLPRVDAGAVKWQKGMSMDDLDKSLKGK